MGVTARDIMTPLSECVSEDDILLEALRRMVDFRFAPLPIISSDGCVRGTLQAIHVVMTLTDGRHPAEIRVAEVREAVDDEFTPSGVSIPAESSIDDTRTALAGTEDQVLVKEGNNLIGVVMREDIESYVDPPDGMPLPPSELMRLVLGAVPPRRLHYKLFYKSGARTVEKFRQILREHGAEFSDFEAILDFGCGCGRLIRHWNGLTRARVHGCDYNPVLLDWCRHNLPFAEFALNDLEPPLRFENEAFDFVYAFSVFTHLDTNLQTRWIDELRRVTRPNGLLLLTLHGQSHLGDLDTEDRQRFLAGEPVIKKSELAGRNECAAFHPERYVYETLARDLSVMTLLPNFIGPIGGRQDAVLLRNRQDAA